MKQPIKNKVLGIIFLLLGAFFLIAALGLTSISIQGTYVGANVLSSWAEAAIFWLFSVGAIRAGIRRIRSIPKTKASVLWRTTRAVAIIAVILLAILGELSKNYSPTVSDPPTVLFDYLYIQDRRPSEWHEPVQNDSGIIWLTGLMDRDYKESSQSFSALALVCFDPNKSPRGGGVCFVRMAMNSQRCEVEQTSSLLFKSNEFEHRLEGNCTGGNIDFVEEELLITILQSDQIAVTYDVDTDQEQIFEFDLSESEAAFDALQIATFGSTQE